MSNMRILLGAGVFSDSFGAFAHSVLGEFTGQQESHCGLNLPTGDRRTFIVVRKTRSFRGDTFEDVVDETVHDAHRLTGNTGVGMNLFQHLVDVDSVTLLALTLLLLVALRNILLGLAGFFRSFTARLRWHV